MYEYSVTLRLVPGKQAICNRLLRKLIIPVLKNQPGLISLGLVPRPEENQITILSEWRHESDAIAAETAPGYLTALRQLDPYLADKPLFLPMENN